VERVNLKAVRRVRPVSLLRVRATVRRLSRLAARLAPHQTNPEPAPTPLMHRPSSFPSQNNDMVVTQEVLVAAIRTVVQVLAPPKSRSPPALV